MPQGPTFKPLPRVPVLFSGDRGFALKLFSSIEAFSLEAVFFAGVFFIGTVTDEGSRKVVQAGRSGKTGTVTQNRILVGLCHLVVFPASSTLNCTIEMPERTGVAATAAIEAADEAAGAASLFAGGDGSLFTMRTGSSTAL